MKEQECIKVALPYVRPVNDPASHTVSCPLSWVEEVDTVISSAVDLGAIISSCFEQQVVKRHYYDIHSVFQWLILHVHCK